MKRILKIAKVFFLSFVSLVFLLLLLFQIPYIQSKAAKKALEVFLPDSLSPYIYFSRLKLGFTGKATIYDFLLNSPDEGKILELNRLSAQVRILPFLRHRVSVKDIYIAGLEGKLYRYKNGEMNINPFINRFAQVDTIQSKEKSEANDPMTIVIGDIVLKDINFSYHDSLSQVYLDVDLGQFETNMRNSRIQDLVFSFDKMILVKTSVNLGLDESLIDEEPETPKDSVILPVIDLNRIKISDVSFRLDQYDCTSFLEANVGQFSGNEILVDIINAVVRVDNLELLKSEYRMDYTADTIPDDDEADTSTENEKIKFSGGWTISADQMTGKDNNIYLFLEKEDTLQNKFNPLNMWYNDLSFSFEHAEVNNGEVKANIKDVSCRISDYINLKNIVASTHVSNNELDVTFDEVRTSRSKFSIGVNSKTQLINPALDNTRLNKIELKGRIDPKDLNFFLPGRLNLPNIENWNDFQAEITLSGSKDHIVFSPFSLYSKDVLDLKISGVLNDAQNIDSLFVDGRIDTIVCNPGILFPDQKYTSGILTGHVGLKGYPNDIKVNYLFRENSGSVAGKINIKSDSLRHFVKGNVKVHDFEISAATDSLVELPVSAEIKYSAALTGFSRLNSFSTQGQVTNLQIDSIYLDTINLNGYFKEGALAFGLKHRSDLIDIGADLNGTFLDSSKVFDYDLNCRRFQTDKILNADEDVQIRARTKGKVSIAGKAMCFSGNVMNMTLLTSEKRYGLSDLSYNISQEDDQKSIVLKSNELDLTASSNMEPQRIVKNIKDIVFYRLSPFETYSLEPGDQFRLHANLEVSDSIEDFITYSLLDSLIMDSLIAEIDLSRELINVSTFIDQIAFKGVCVNGLNISYNQNLDCQKINFGIDHFLYKDYISNSICLKTNLDDENFKGSLDIYNDSSDRKLHLPVFAFVDDSVLSINLYDSLLIGYKQWRITDQEIVNYNYNSKKWFSHGVEIAQGDQSIRFEESLSELGCHFKNVRLNHMASKANDEEDKILFNTILSGSFYYSEKLNDQWLFKTDLSFDDLSLVGQQLGILKIKADQTDTNNIDLAMHLANQKDYLDYAGSFGKDSNHLHKANIYIENLAKYNFIIDTNLFRFGRGSLQADLDLIMGDKTDVAGRLNLKDTKLISTDYGLDFYLEDEKITVDKGILSLDNITVRDENNNVLLLKGTVNSVNYPDLLLDLSVKSDHFQLMNSTRKQNENAYGQINVSTNITLKGPYKHPQLKARLSIHDNTELTVTLPDETQTNTTQDIVSFEKEEEIITDSLYITKGVEEIKEQIESQFSLDQSYIQILFSPGASYKIITNAQSGDYAEFGLAGALEYKSLRENLFELNGNIKVVNGTYEMSFYQMIKKEFTITPNSTIYFTGPLSNASIDLSAKNIVKTNSVGLMAGETMGTSANEQALYNQRLPYELIFKVRGNLLSPKVSFALDLPDEYKQSSPMIASRLDRLASSENEQERNMQVFALLVTGGFISQSTGSGTSNVAMTTARNSLNSILSQQLNNLTSNNIQFVDVNFGFNTYEDYEKQGGQTTTDLDVQISKKMFNNRVSLEVDSRINLDGSSNSYYGSSNYNTDYKMYFDITKSGRVKLKAYNLALYDLFDGDITNAGFGLMFSKDIEDRRRKNYVEIDSLQTDE